MKSKTKRNTRQDCIIALQDSNTDKLKFLIKDHFSMYRFVTCTPSNAITFKNEEVANKWIHSNYHLISHLIKDNQVLYVYTNIQPTKIKEGVVDNNVIFSAGVEHSDN